VASACNNNASLEEESIYLELLQKTPNETSDFFFQNPINFDLDQDQNIYVSDQSASQILKFNQRLKFLKYIGNPGRGPGELNSQRSLVFESDSLFVDNGLNVQIYDRNGNDLRLFSTFGIERFVINENIIYANKYNVNPRSVENFDEKNLIKKLDMNGNVITEFCKVLDIVPSDFHMHRFMASGMWMEIYDNKLFVLFKYYPILRVFDLEDNTLIKEIQFEKINSDLRYKYRVSQNYETDTFKRPNVMGTTYLFKEIEVNEKGIFVGIFDESFKVDQFNFDGDFLRTYKIKNGLGKFMLTDFKVTTNQDEIQFFVLGSVGENYTSQLLKLGTQ
jgi:hypothetical protein